MTGRKLKLARREAKQQQQLTKKKWQCAVLGHEFVRALIPIEFVRALMPIVIRPERACIRCDLKQQLVRGKWEDQ